MNVIDDILWPREDRLQMPNGEFNNDPLLMLEGYKKRLSAYFKQQELKPLHLNECFSNLQAKWVDGNYYRAYAHLLLNNYGVPARIFPTLNEEQRNHYGMTLEICRFIAQYGRCTEDEARFMNHTLGEYDDHFKSEKKSDESSNIISTITVDKDKSASFAKAEIEKAIKRMEEEMEHESDEKLKEQIVKDIAHLTEELAMLTNPS